MKKLLILLFSILISFNSYGISKVDYYGNGIIYSVENYKYKGATRSLSVPHGKSIYYFENGGIMLEEYYKDGNLVHENYWKEGGGYWIWRKDSTKNIEQKFEDGKKHGIWTLWYEDRKEQGGNFKHGKYDGKLTWWYENGQRKYEFSYKDDNRDGEFTYWDENGQIELEAIYKDEMTGERDGKLTWWYKNGHIEAEATYKDGVCISGDCDSFKNW